MTDNRTEVKLDFEPWDGTPGDPYDKFEIRLLNASSRTDDRGWSLADHLLGNDEGGPAGPAFPAAAVAQNKAQIAFRKRQKESYGILTKHITANARSGRRPSMRASSARSAATSRP